MYCPKINYCFSADDIRTLNERIKSIAEAYHDDETGWFEVGPNEKLIFIDRYNNKFIIHLLGRFWRKLDPEFDLEVVELEKDEIIFSFDVNIFENHI